VSAQPSDFEAVLRALPAGVVVLDRAGHVTLCNEAAALLCGKSVVDVEGRDFFRDVAPSAEVPEIAGAFRDAMHDDSPLDTEREILLTFGERSIDVRVRMRALRVGTGAGVVVLMDDNTRRKRSERAMAQALTEAQDQAIRDPLTGLFNRRYIETVLPGELSRVQRHQVPLSLLIVDVDHFKLVNDRFGHPVGDRVLLRLAGVMQRMRRVSDTCARLGGEEFCIVLPHVPSAAARAAAERLHRVIRALRFEEEAELRVTVSIGVATTPATLHAGDFEGQMRELLQRADDALYEAKRTGRDRTVVRE
jgi:photoactive yellow protein